MRLGYDADEWHPMWGVIAWPSALIPIMAVVYGITGFKELAPLGFGVAWAVIAISAVLFDAWGKRKRRVRGRHRV